MNASTSQSRPLSNHTIVILWFALSLSMVFYLFHALQIRSDISFFLPDKQTEVDSIIRYQLSHGEAGKIIIIALSTTIDSSDSTELLARLNKQLASRLISNSQFTFIQNGNLSAAKLFIEPYYQYRYLLQSFSNNEFSIQSLTEKFQQLQQQLQILPSLAEKKLLTEDPLMLWPQLLRQWQTQKLAKYHGVWFDQQQKQSLLFVKTRAEAYDLKQQQINIDTITANIADLSTQQDEIQTILSGAPVFALASKQAISSQIKFISVFATIILLAFLYWVFRSFKIIFLLGLAPAFAVLSGLTTVILFDGFIHGISIAFGITIIGIAVDYPVHFYSHLISVTAQRSTSQTAIMHTIWPRLRLGLITTLIGFSAIIFSDFSGLKQLGLFSISGLFAAAMLSRFLLPAINIVSIKKPQAFNKLLHLSNLPIPQILYKIFLILPIVALLYIVLHQEQLWEDDIAALSPVPAIQKQQDFKLRKAIGLAELRHSLIIQADTAEQVLQYSALLKPHLDKLQQQGIISGYDMASRYLPDSQLQQQQQEKLPNTRELTIRLQAALQDSPLSAAAFSPFIESVERAKSLPTLKIQAILNSHYGQPSDNIISDKIKTLIFPTELLQDINYDKKWTAIIPLQGVTQTLALQQLVQSLKLPLQVLDLKTQTEKMLTHYRSDALFWFALGLALIILILFMHQKKLSVLITLILPFCGAVILTITTLLLMGYSLSIFHLVTLLLVIGLGIDYSIFMQSSEGEAFASTEVAQVSVIICLISTLIMFGALSLSALPVLNAIGLTASLGACYAFLLALSIHKILPAKK